MFELVWLCCEWVWFLFWRCLGCGICFLMWEISGGGWRFGVGSSVYCCGLYVVWVFEGFWFLMLFLLKDWGWLSWGFLWYVRVVILWGCDLINGLVCGWGSRVLIWGGFLVWCYLGVSVVLRFCFVWKECFWRSRLVRCSVVWCWGLIVYWSCWWVCIFWFCWWWIVWMICLFRVLLNVVFL